MGMFMSSLCNEPLDRVCVLTVCLLDSVLSWRSSRSGMRWRMSSPLRVIWPWPPDCAGVESDVILFWVMSVCFGGVALGCKGYLVWQKSHAVVTFFIVKVRMGIVG
jgi:hypothetical protein